MSYALLKDLAADFPKGRVLGLDPGTKTIGVAVSDGLQMIASPVEIIRRTKFSKDVLRLSELARELDIQAFIMGYPLNMDGSEGPRCQSVRHFAQNIAARKDLFPDEPVIGLWDERLTTAETNRFLVDEMDMSRKKRAGAVDKIAAQIILQSALNFLSEMRHNA